MAFANREAAVILAKELNRHAGGFWFYKVEQHIDRRRWIAVREPPSRRMRRRATAKRGALLATG